MKGVYHKKGGWIKSYPDLNGEEEEISPTDRSSGDEKKVGTRM